MGARLVIGDGDDIYGNFYWNISTKNKGQSFDRSGKLISRSMLEKPPQIINYPLLALSDGDILKS